MKKLISITILCILYGCSTSSRFVKVSNNDFKQNKISDFFIKKGDTLELGANLGDRFMQVNFVQILYNHKTNKLKLKGVIKSKYSNEVIAFAHIYIGTKDNKKILIKEKLGHTDVYGKFYLTVSCKEDEVLIFSFISFLPVVYDIDSCFPPPANKRKPNKVY